VPILLVNDDWTNRGWHSLYGRTGGARRQSVPKEELCSRDQFECE